MIKNDRLRALNILQNVIEHQKNLQECLTKEDTPFVYQLTYGTLRHYFSLSQMVNYALQKPLSASDQDLFLVLLLGLYQLKYLDVPDYAVLKETVNIADKIKKSWAKKLINAVLRRFLREKEKFEIASQRTEEGKFEHQQWFIEHLKKSWPENWKEILKANNEKPPLHLRVNKIKISRDEYLKKLADLSIAAYALNTAPEGISLNQAMDVRDLPGFKEGWISVQDVASQAVVDYLDLKPNQRVLDACAAPGGKACHMLETESNLSELVCLDNNSARIKKMTENFERLNLNATALCGDAANPETWWDKKLFDRILLDAPCTATGVIRRHSDIKIRRTPEAIENAIVQQKIILKALWPLLKSEGLLVYTTCSILPEENQQQLEDFLENHANAQLLTLKQIFPGNEDNADGFFYAVIKKLNKGE